jgi:pimeloyl-ACP methyl ester carboxylesterase/RimJ/RimL family protein N-acetyltransferase
VVIETDRLALRPLERGDLDEFVALHNDPQVVRFMRRLDRQQAGERLRAIESEWEQCGYGMFAVSERASGSFVGRAGLKYWPEFDETEVGWALRGEACGEGYATEAARAAIAWGFRSFGLSYLTAMIRPANARSIAVAQRLGMAPLREELLSDHEVIVYSLSRERWVERSGRLPLWYLLERDGVRLAARDFGGAGPAVLLLHGLAGHAEEWVQTAGWLTERYRVVALEERGHGRSSREPAEVSPQARLADAAFVIECLRLAPVVVIGQSLGAHLGILLAAKRPELVRALVVAEATPAGGNQALVDEVVEQVSDSLRRWPVPFSSREAALEYFGGRSLKAEAWSAGLDARADGLWPRFDVSVLRRMLRDAVSRDHWREWERISCPVLIVRAQHGTLEPADANAMAKRLPQARCVEIPGAGHDLHLERPEAWRRAVIEFLESIDQGR